MAARWRMLTVLVALLPGVAAAVPMQLAHQGELSDADGPVTDTLDFNFALFDAEEGGSEVWTEDHTIDVIEGAYSVLLGTETPVAAVLAAEPALWLEITVEDSAPLLPRQPVASTPYAILADTAVNVDGGTVNASSLSVNGTTVVNADGDWIGPGGSIDWSSLAGVPAGLDDGDADTLSGLSCVDGERAVWNDSLGLWECGSSQVGLDRIDVSGASTGDLLGFDGAGAAWIADSSTNCTTTVIGDDLAEIDCGSGPIRVQVYPEYLDATSCWRLLADGTLRGLPACSSTAPSGTFTEIGGASACQWALSTAGAVVMLLTYNPLPPPPATYISVTTCDHARGIGCALTAGGAVTCWNTDTSSFPPPGMSGTGYLDFAVSELGYASQTICAISAMGQVQCVGDVAYSSHAPSGTGWTQIDSSGSGYFYAVSDAGSYAKWSKTGSYPGSCGGTGPYQEFSGSTVLDTAGAAWTCGDSPGATFGGYPAPIRRFVDTPGVVLTDGRLYSGSQLSN